MAVSAINVTGRIDPVYIGTGRVDHSSVLVAYIPILLPFAILIIPLLDFGLAVLRRLRAGKSPFSADRKHLHHRLLDMGHSHLHAVLIFYAWTLVASVGLLIVPVRPVVVGRTVHRRGIHRHERLYSRPARAAASSAEAEAQLTEVSDDGCRGGRGCREARPAGCGCRLRCRAPKEPIDEQRHSAAPGTALRDHPDDRGHRDRIGLVGPAARRDPSGW